MDRSVIMKITGHKTMNMFERYNMVDESDALEAYRKLHFFLNAPPTGGEITAILRQALSSK